MKQYKITKTIAKILIGFNVCLFVVVFTAIYLKAAILLKKSNLAI